MYANFGDATDFDQLHAKSVSCKDKIIIMRYGKICSGIKVSYICVSKLMYTASVSTLNIAFCPNKPLEETNLLCFI